MPATIITQLDKLLKKRLKGFATKDDLKQFATKNDLTGFATKDDLKQFATKDDLKGFATKDDLTRLLQNYPTKKYLSEALDDLLVDIIKVVDKTKADKADVEILEKRVDKIEGQLSPF